MNRLAFWQEVYLASIRNGNTSKTAEAEANSAVASYEIAIEKYGNKPPQNRACGGRLPL